MTPSAVRSRRRRPMPGHGGNQDGFRHTSRVCNVSLFNVPQRQKMTTESHFCRASTRDKVEQPFRVIKRQHNISNILFIAKRYSGIAILISITTISLSACGGGYSDGDSSSPPTLKLFEVWNTFATGSTTVTGVISGYCQGTKKETFEPKGLG